MNARRLLPLGLLVAGLLAIAGIASRGRPLGGARRGTGPNATFFDYVATTLVILAIALGVFAVYAFYEQRAAGGEPRRGRWHLLATLVSLALSVAVAMLLLHTGFIDRLRRLEAQHQRNQQSQQAQQPRQTPNRNARNPRLRWDEIAIVAALLLGTAAVVVAGRRTRKQPRGWAFTRREVVAQAIDHSIDDLRKDPNLRRAIIAAYARMETALARSGVGRRASEAPFEYMERALVALETSGDSAEQLTGLFERAKFSQHEPEPGMRDDAITALLAVRDELAREPVTA